VNYKDFLVGIKDDIASSVIRKTGTLDLSKNRAQKCCIGEHLGNIACQS
jgi:hypothetical protein